MTIAFDFDGTIDADPDTMLAAMAQFSGAGHQVIVATGRGDTRENRAQIERATGGRVGTVDIGYDLLGTRHHPHLLTAGGSVFRIVFCRDYRDKNAACKANGFRVDVWVDDMPETCREVLLIGKDGEL